MLRRSSPPTTSGPRAVIASGEPAHQKVVGLGGGRKAGSFSTLRASDWRRTPPIGPFSSGELRLQLRLAAGSCSSLDALSRLLRLGRGEAPGVGSRHSPAGTRFERNEALTLGKLGEGLEASRDLGRLRRRRESSAFRSDQKPGPRCGKMRREGRGASGRGGRFGLRQGGPPRGGLTRADRNASRRRNAEAPLGRNRWGGTGPHGAPAKRGRPIGCAVRVGRPQRIFTRAVQIERIEGLARGGSHTAVVPAWRSLAEPGRRRGLAR